MNIFYFVLVGDVLFMCTQFKFMIGDRRNYQRFLLNWSRGGMYSKNDYIALNIFQPFPIQTPKPNTPKIDIMAFPQSKALFYLGKKPSKMTPDPYGEYSTYCWKRDIAGNAICTFLVSDKLLAERN